MWPSKKSILYGLGLVFPFWATLAILLFMLLGCSGDPQADLGKELDSLQADFRAAVYLRSSALDRVAGYYAVGNVVARRNTTLRRAAVYEIGRAVLEYSRAAGLSPTLVLAVLIVESNGDVYARSPKGARGLMQVMPHMARELGYHGDLYVIDANIRIGTFILADNIRRWGYTEGIQRYFWGTRAEPDGTYLAKVQRAKEALGG